jgi:hypothetical protein
MKLRSLTTLALVIATVAVSVSRADNIDSYIGHPVGTGATGPVVLPAGSYIGHPGGPGASGPALVATTARASSGGFDWGDAGVGAGFASGIALLTTGAWLASRRREVATQHSQP